MSDENIITLSREIETHSGKVKSIKLKEPSGSVVLKYGMPFNALVSGDGDNSSVEIRFNMVAMPKYLEDMTGLDMIVLETASAVDLAKMMQAVVTMMSGAPKN